MPTPYQTRRLSAGGHCLAALELILRFTLNLLAAGILLFGLFWPRYKNKEITLAAALFNVFTFGVLSILSAVEFTLAAGFGLFAILALFNLRSETINKSDIGYFFGSIAIAVITSIDGSHLGFVLLILLVVLTMVYVVDHPRFFQASRQLQVTLDYIPDHLFGSPEELNRELSQRLQVTVLNARLLSVNFVTEVVRTDISYRDPS